MAGAGWWHSYFDADFLRIYRDFLTPERTQREVAGLREMLALPYGARILDLACGWGRHSVELARAGFAVTGLDLSPTLLDEARRRADEAGVQVEWVRCDMRNLPWSGEFDAVLSLFSSLGYFGSDADDLRVLRAAHQALRPGGALLLETMHRDQVVAAYAERDWWETEDATTVWMEREWDAVRGISHELLRWRRADQRGERHHRIRVRSATEWRRLLRRAGLQPLEWYGDWDRAPFDRASEQLIVLARAES